MKKNHLISLSHVVMYNVRPKSTIIPPERHFKVTKCQNCKNRIIYFPPLTIAQCNSELKCTNYTQYNHKKMKKVMLKAISIAVVFLDIDLSDCFLLPHRKLP